MVKERERERERASLVRRQLETHNVGVLPLEYVICLRIGVAENAVLALWREEHIRKAVTDVEQHGLADIETAAQLAEGRRGVKAVFLIHHQD